MAHPDPSPVIPRYSREKLQNGVLDIAGGRGELAFELCVKRQIPCVVLDPRCPGGDTDGGAAAWKDWRVSRQQRLWFKSQGIRSYQQCQEYVANCPLKQCQVPVETALKALRDQDEEWKDVLKCEVVVGLHPDQATGGILELARALGRPFAVVPCCTFADEFPERRLGDRPVRTYDDLVEWLLAFEGTSPEKGFLMFFGKNLVVYTKSQWFLPLISGQNGRRKWNRKAQAGPWKTHPVSRGMLPWCFLWSNLTQNLNIFINIPKEGNMHTCPVIFLKIFPWLELQVAHLVTHLPRGMLIHLWFRQERPWVSLAVTLTAASQNCRSWQKVAHHSGWSTRSTRT